MTEQNDGFAESFAMPRTVTTGVTLLGGLLAAMIAPAFYRWMLRRQARRFLGETVGTTEEAEFTISPAGVLKYWASGEASLRWDAFTEVVGSADHICLYQGRSIANVIPRRAFPTPEAAEIFLDAAREWHAAALAAGSA